MEKADKLAEVNWSTRGQVTGSVPREAMRIEVRGLQDQDCRQRSVILGGFQVENKVAVMRKFEICMFLNVGNVELREDVTIEDAGLFRAKILNKEKRFLLLSKVKT